MGASDETRSAQATTPTIRIFLCGDVMTGRGIDQALVVSRVGHVGVAVAGYAVGRERERPVDLGAQSDRIGAPEPMSIEAVLAAPNSQLDDMHRRVGVSV